MKNESLYGNSLGVFPFPFPWHLRVRVWIASTVVRLLVPRNLFILACRVIVAAEDLRRFGAVECACEGCLRRAKEEVDGSA